MSDYLEHLKCQLSDHFGPSTRIISIKGAGHYPRVHVEADVLAGSDTLRLFLKGLKPERQEAEIHAYRHVLPSLEIRVPHLYGCFPDCEYPIQWLILERIEGRWSDLKVKGDVAGLFRALGRLHAQGIRQTPTHISKDERFAFPSGRDENDLLDMRSTLARNVSELSLDDRVVEEFERNIGFLRESPKTWIHGDNHVSNMLVCSDGICLIDWETFTWASPALDLGNLISMIHIVEGCEGTDAHFQEYQEAFGGSIGPDEIGRWVSHGLFFDGIKWISYYCNRRDDDAWDRPGWFRLNGLPRIKRINDLIARKALQ